MLIFRICVFEEKYSTQQDARVKKDHQRLSRMREDTEKKDQNNKNFAHLNKLKGYILKNPQSRKKWSKITTGLFTHFCRLPLVWTGCQTQTVRWFSQR